MIKPHLQFLSAISHSIEPTVGTAQVGFRAYSGNLPSTQKRLALRAWVLVYDQCFVADNYYDLFVALFNEVGIDGHIALPVEGVMGAKFGNLSERADLLGERATIWVSTMEGDGDGRGAVLASVVDNAITLLTVDPYVGFGGERAVVVLESIANTLADRAATFTMSANANTMVRLPTLEDIGGLLDNTRIERNWYDAS